MSRIHEALKKAAEERSAQNAGKTVSDLVDLSGSVAPPATVLTAEPRPDNGRVQLKNEPAIAQFQEFAKRCTAATWKIEPSASVFSAHMEHQAGAEKFRTLRSRLYQIASSQPLKRILVTSSVP